MSSSSSSDPSGLDVREREKGEEEEGIGGRFDSGHQRSGTIGFAASCLAISFFWNIDFTCLHHGEAQQQQQQRGEWCVMCDAHSSPLVSNPCYYAPPTRSSFDRLDWREVGGTDKISTTRKM